MGSIIFNGKRINNVKFAITKDEQIQGLMGVRWPPPIMVFPYKKAAVKRFWMKDTPSPLDIIFCKANRVIYITNGLPYNESFVGPTESCDLVIEGPVGFADENNIRIGSKIRAVYNQNELLKILLTKDQ
ncbi:MAG TPA: DUF192 domain-containing protein [Candidatus Glassbacteria bacterium]|nr:DUF192 domain-containing protein [Candidatus Glassbacteria bacterium]